MRIFLPKIDGFASAGHYVTGDLPPHLSLLTFPREIRDKIYEVLVSASKPITIFQRADTSNEGTGGSHQPLPKDSMWHSPAKDYSGPPAELANLLRVSKIVHSEVWDCFCRLNTIALLPLTLAGSVERQASRFFSQPNGQDAMARMRSIELTIVLPATAFNGGPERRHMLDHLRNAQLPHLKSLKVNMIMNGGIESTVDDSQIPGLTKAFKDKVKCFLHLQVKCVHYRWESKAEYFERTFRIFLKIAMEVIDVDFSRLKEVKVEGPRSQISQTRPVVLENDTHHVWALFEPVLVDRAVSHLMRSNWWH